MDIVVVGAGYVGLVSGVCFAELGHRVTCVDLSRAKIEALRQGKSPIFEPGLEELIVSNSKAGRLSFSTDLGEAVKTADVAFIAVGTPSRPEDGRPDLSYVDAAARDIARAARRGLVVVCKSTVPVGTGDALEATMREVNPLADIVVASNPEFLREGVAIDDFLRPDRIVVGVEDQRARVVMREVYAPFGDQVPLLFVSRRTSELIKYSANSFLSMKISFINEIADLCEAAGADVQEVAQGIGLDTRIGRKFLNAGPGYGGSCFPKDTLGLVKTAQDFGTPLRLIETTIEINDERKKAMADKIIAASGGSLESRRVAILGLTFKPGTDDMRDAPSIDIIAALQAHGAKIFAYDPGGVEQAKEILQDVTYCADPYAAAEQASALVIVTEWDEFRELDFARLGSLVADRNLVDLRNVYRAEDVLPFGFSYAGIGRPSQAAAPDLAEPVRVRAVG